MIKKLLFLLLPFFAFSQHTALLKKGDSFFNKSVNDSAVFYYNAGIKNCITCDETILAGYYLKFGEANRLLGDNAIALKNFLKAEKIFDNLKNNDGIVAAKVYLADFYRSINNLEKSFSLIEEAAKINKNHPISKKIIAHYYNRRAAIVAQKFDDKEKVITLSKKAIQIAEEIGEYKLMIYSYNELAYVYESQKKRELSLTYYFKALNLAKKLELGVETCDVLFNIGREEFLRIEYSQVSPENETPLLYKHARDYFIEGLELATKIKYLERQKDFSKRLFHNFFRTRQFEEAIKYNELYQDYNVQLLIGNKREEIVEIEAKYLDEKKDNLIKLNENKIKIQYVVLASFGVLLVLLFFFFMKSKKDKTNIEAQKNKIEEVLTQKIVLLKEIHHRVKNNLQLISGLLYLQSVKHKNTKVTEVIDESQKHINSIALVHEMLYQDDTLSLVSMEKYLKELGSRLLQISSQGNIEYKLSVNAISLPIDYATTIGLILNELITNSLKYAFKMQEGVVSISLYQINYNEYQLVYSDNGEGFGIDVKNNTNKTLGQKLIKMLAEEIGADLTIKNEKGLTYTFNFKTKTT